MAIPKQFDETNRGTLSPNADKQKPDANPKWPDYKGRINIHGQWHWFDAWKRNSKNGPFLSVSIGPKIEPRGNAPASQRPAMDVRERVTCVDEHGEKHTLSRDIANKLGYKIIENTSQSSDDDVPF